MFTLILLKKICDRLYSETTKIKLKLIYGNRFIFGDNLYVRSKFKLTIDDGEVLIRDNVFFNGDCSINCLSRVYIGNDCMFGEGVKLYDHNHGYKESNKLMREQKMSKASIRIGNNCWIGSNVTILKNIEIGDNTIIGANCVIYKSIPSNSIVKCGQQLIIEKK